MSSEFLDITPSPRLLQVLGDIPMEPWQCLAELVDNSLDELHKFSDRDAENPLVINIDITEGDRGEVFLTVTDNGKGMSRDQLERSLRAGHSDKLKYGTLGLFGMGFNIATARLGNVTSVTTRSEGSGEALRATIDFQEMQKRESFHIPLESVDVAPDFYGTSVRTLLHRDMGSSLKRAQVKATLREQLGDVYSFMLRDGVPGLTKGRLSQEVPVEIWLDGIKVKARIPCVWSEQRSVRKRGQDVYAIQYIDEILPTATACLECGYWDRKNGPEECEECGSSMLQERERRIWGWLGIQRYLDTSDFGIDFLRYGRKIRLRDKSTFVYQDPDTLQEDREYPIEMPANRGRIVGEIHLDHVPVNYQKSDFVRERRDWQVALEKIRGTSGLKQSNSRDQVNDSPLARLFSAYRRNAAGLADLIPGSDEGREIHSRAREWGTYFHKGVERFQDDTEWYLAAQAAEAKRTGEKGTETKEDPPPGAQPGGGKKKELLGPKDDPQPEAPKPSPGGSQTEVLAAARELGRRRDDLGGHFKLGRALGEWSVTVWITRERLVDENGSEIPAMPGELSGTEFEIFLAQDHVLFTEFDRSFQDMSLIVAADMIRGLSGTSKPVHDVYSALVLEIDDLRTTRPMLLETIADVESRLQDRLRVVQDQIEESLWDLIPTEKKVELEEAAAVRFANETLADLVEDGRFVYLCSVSTVSAMVSRRPEVFFDGRVFRPTFSKRPPSAQDRLVAQVRRELDGLAAFRGDELATQRRDLQLARVNLEALTDQIVYEDKL